MSDNYFFIDGSALTAQIRQLRRSKKSFVGRKLCPNKFIDHYMNNLHDLHDGSYKRAVFYFPSGDEAAIEDYIDVPDHRKPKAIRDIYFKFCGYKLKKSAEFIKFVEETVPPQFQDRFSKSEKGIDIEICCDALKLASSGRVSRIFLLTNDGDFIPFCRVVKEFGANISVVHLSDATSPNGDLLREADSYDVVPANALESLFSEVKQKIQIDTEPPSQTTIQFSSDDPDKPDAEASDLDTSELKSEKNG